MRENVVVLGVLPDGNAPQPFTGRSMIAKLMVKAVLALATAFIIQTIPSAVANDSSAELAIGGLVFTKNPHVELRKEDLFISTREIRVRYVFFNESDRDITNTVAFPMPDITSDDLSSNIVIPTDDPENIVDFSTFAAGRSVNAGVERKVFAKSIDQTIQLRRLGVPLAPHLESTQAALDNLPREEWSRLIDLGLVEKEVYSTGLYPHTVMEEHLVPRWSLKTTYYWQQKFPARHELVIEHRYKPSVGTTVPIDTTMAVNLLRAEYHGKYCVESDIIRDVAEDDRHHFSQERIEYILTTGANWAGPIREFTLVVDKGVPENLVSFCGHGVRKVGPTQFEMRKSNFIPTQNLSVLILKREQPPSQEQSPAPVAREVTLGNTCDELWYQRNSIFKFAKYCFKTPRAIRVFGNAGCQYDNELDVPLSGQQRQVINEIRAAEAAKRCAR
jgi:hypothetical protein